MRHFLLSCLFCISVSMLLAQKGQFPYDSLGSFKEDMAMVRKSGWFGFINRDYKEAIPPVYLTTYDYSEGVAAVEVYDSIAAAEGNSTWIFIDKQGKQAVPGKYQYVDYSFSEGLAVVEKDYKKLVINKKGEVVVTADPSWEMPFQYGFAKAKNEQMQYGVVNLKGELVVPMEYEQIILLSPNLLQVSRDGKTGFYNTQGKELRKLMYQEVDTLSNGFIKLMVNGKIGLLNRQGKEIVSPLYSQVENFEEGLACVLKNNKWGYINETGKEVIAAKYEFANSFINGKAAVTLNSKELYIDRKGKYVDENYTNFVLSNESLTKESVEKAFLQILNGLVKTYHPVTGQGEELLLDSLFSIQNGFLVGTCRKYTANGFILERLMVPVAKIQEVWYDYNMGFYIEENTGIIQIKKPGTTSIEEEGASSMVLLATPKDGAHGWRLKEQLTIALNALKKYYP